jgi:tRNA A37 threonylcarbamoyladenosine synthetase subunit TsaC/SUA5/YrdC
MPQIPIIMPQLGESIAEATIVSIAAKVGDNVKADQDVLEVETVIDSGDCGTEPTTVIDFSQPEPEIVRRGAGDTSGFE